MILIVLPELAEEDALLARARSGDREAILTIYDLYFPPVYQFIRLRTDDPMLAEDLASEVFVTLVSALRGRNAPRQSLRGWIFRVARSVLHAHYGKARRFTAVALEDWMPEPDEEGLESAAIRRMNMDAARQAIAGLNPEQQEVLILRFGQKLSVQDTADVMGKSIPAIKSLQFRAVNALRQLLGVNSLGGLEFSRD